MINSLHEQSNDAIALEKKPFYPIQGFLHQYLKTYRRLVNIKISYKDLLHFSNSMPLVDKYGNDTLWETVFYRPSDQRELFPALIAVYTMLKVNGNAAVHRHLFIDRVDYCTFGNSKPFRIKVQNNINDNYDYFYVKVADASRVYGLELEDILSPNRIGYKVYDNTLIEEHIAGIPGDRFLQAHLGNKGANPTRIAKEFVKFNERCFIKLLGDMRSYNFVMDVTPDFDDTQYRIRAIDFDQQCYEGRLKLYLPQFFKENYPYVQLGIEHMSYETMEQYQEEERTLISNRVKMSRHQLMDLYRCIVSYTFSTPEKTKQLSKELAEHYKSTKFLRAKKMGDLVRLSLRHTVRHHLV